MIALLTTAPGVGPVVAASFVSVIDEAKRCRNAHQVESYLGLVPGEDSTGGKRRLGAITRKGSSYLRAVLVQASWAILRGADRQDPLRLWAEAVQKRRGKKIAVIALARRLAGVMWAMWRDGTVYGGAARSGADRKARLNGARAEVGEAPKLLVGCGRAAGNRVCVSGGCSRPCASSDDCVAPLMCFQGNPGESNGCF